MNKKRFDIKRIVKFAFHLQEWDFLYFILQADGHWQGEYDSETWDDREESFSVEYCVLSERKTK